MSIRHLIFHNFWLKLFSLGLASVIWIAVHSQIPADPATAQTRSRSMTRQEITLPISIVTQQGDSRVFRLSSTQAVATAVAEDSVMAKLSRKSIMIYVDLSDYRGRQPTNAELRVYAPAEVSILNLRPANVGVEIISP